MYDKKTITIIISMVVLVVLVFNLVLFLSNRKKNQTTSQKATNTTTTVSNTSKETSSQTQSQQGSETKTTTTEENITQMSPDLFSSDAQANLQLAQQKAAQWQEDAAFVALQIKLTSLKPKQGVETYVFDSPTVSGYHFLVTISQQSQKYIRALVPVEDYLGASLLPIDFKYWQLNYVEALQLAEKQGGSEFRKRHSDWMIELTLRREPPNNWLYWRIEYSSGAGDKWSIWVNPYSGEVVQNESVSPALP